MWHVKKQPPEVFYEKVLLNIPQKWEKNTYVGVSFLIKFKEEPSAQVFSCEFCEIFTNNLFTKHLRLAASKRY